MHDVVVVGAGPTGLLLAVELKLAGITPVVVDSRSGAVRESRGTNLHARTLEHLDLRGVADRFTSEANRVPEWHFAGLPTTLALEALDTRFKGVFLLAQRRTEELLLDWLNELGIQVLWQHTALDVRSSETGATVDVDSPYGRTTLTSRYLVGCDGGRSLVREAAGISFSGAPHTLTTTLADVRIGEGQALPALNHPRVRVLRLPGGITRFVFRDPDQQAAALTHEVGRAEVRGALSRLAQFDIGDSEIVWTSRFGNASRLADRYRAGTLFLAGDAAHTQPPTGGQGMNVGMQDAANLGWKLGAALRDPSRAASLLDSYEEERRPVGQSLVNGAAAQGLLAELGGRGDFAASGPALRQLVSNLLAVPDANRLVAADITGLTVHYGVGCTAGDGGAGWIGARLPDLALPSDEPRGIRAYDLFRRAEFVLLRRDFEKPVEPGASASMGTAGRLCQASYRASEEHGLDAAFVLVRPDGYVAWAGDDEATLRDALSVWLPPGNPGAAA